MDMVEFIDTIVYCFIPDILLSKIMNEEILLADVLLSKNISHIAPLASLNKTNNEFAQNLYKNSNVIAFQM